MVLRENVIISSFLRVMGRSHIRLLRAYLALTLARDVSPDGMAVSDTTLESQLLRRFYNVCLSPYLHEIPRSSRANLHELTSESFLPMDHVSDIKSFPLTNMLICSGWG